MRTSQYKQKHIKNKHSGFHIDSHKPQISSLLTNLNSAHEFERKKSVEQILCKRLNKLQQIRKLKPKVLNHSPMKMSNSFNRFSQESPISIGETFLPQKIRTNILAPVRVYNHQPNMKAGSIDQSKMACFEDNYDPRVLNNKFIQFVRVVDGQSGIKKRKRLETEKNIEKSLPSLQSDTKASMKQTYFKKFPTDLYNFYRPAIKDIIRTQNIFDLTAHKFETERSQLSQKRSKVSKSESKQQRKPYYTINLERIVNNQAKIKLRSVARTLDSSRQ